MQLNIKNKNNITVNALFKTTISVTIGLTCTIAAGIFVRWHEWPPAVISLAVSAGAWLRALRRMPLSFMLFAWCGGTAEYEEPTADGVRRMRLSRLPDNRVGAEIILGLAAMAIVAALIPGMLHAAAETVPRAPSHATTPAASTPSHVGRGTTPDKRAVIVIQQYYAAVNKRDWLAMLRLEGHNPARADSAAYRQIAAGYRCTTHDQIMGITAGRGGTTLVRVRAQERNGTVRTIQNYLFSYVIRDGRIRKGLTLTQTGSAPSGCRE